VAPDYFTGPNQIGLTIELRSGPGGGLKGFVLPEEQIAPTGAEVLAAVRAVLEWVSSPDPAASQRRESGGAPAQAGR
jgi:hypothetical protein